MSNHLQYIITVTVKEVAGTRRRKVQWGVIWEGVLYCTRPNDKRMDVCTGGTMPNYK